MTVLRELPGLRRVVRARRGDADVVVRTILSETLDRRYAELVRHACVDGEGSITGLGDDIELALEGYKVAAARLDRANLGWSLALDAGIDDEGFVFVVTPWIEGLPLDEAPLEDLDREARRTLALEVVALVCRLHARGVAHGDLKLANLVRRPTGPLCLIDLDTLRAVPSPRVGVRTLDHTPSWAAPEQKSRQELWLASDTWALARLVRELAGDDLDPAWSGALYACRRDLPSSRPETASLRAFLAGEIASLQAFDGTPIDAAAEPERPLSTEDCAAPTRRLPGEAPGAATRRVEDAAAPGRPAARAPVETTEAVARAARSWFADRPGCAGWIGGLARGALLVAVALIVATGALVLWWQAAQREEADAQAAAVLESMRIHKTDPARNGDHDAREVLERAKQARSIADTPAACGVYALARAWAERWHYGDTWDLGRHDALQAAIASPACRGRPEAALAEATVAAAACRHRRGNLPSEEDCERARAAAKRAAAGLGTGEDLAWMRVEALWQEHRALAALAARWRERGDPRAGAAAEEERALCEAAGAALGYAPVNGPELLQDCLAFAGGVGDVSGYVAAARVLRERLPAEGKPRLRALARFFQEAGPGCQSASVRARAGRWEARGEPACLALGYAALGCAAEASEALRRARPTMAEGVAAGIEGAISQAAGAPCPP